MPTRERSLRRQARLAKLVKALPAPDRGRLLALAGQSEVRLAALIQASISLLEDELSAEKVERLTVPRGAAGGGACEVQAFTDVDTAARHRAAVEILSLTGVYPSKTTGGSGNIAAAKVEITLRSADKGDVIQVVEVPVKPSV